jgi:7,8-dihydropterin-6-yl-methyl-4-(beta-D-ribofuranosyl)aminobenzene 5'-phosphate synthase
MVVLGTAFSPEIKAMEGGKEMRISIIFNNIADVPELKTSWGLAAVIETSKHTILFDSGGDGEILLSNMQELGLDCTAIDKVFLSHIHYDHTGGLPAFLEKNPRVTVYMPQSFPISFQRDILEASEKIETVSEPQQLVDNLYSTGIMGEAIKEQSLIIDTNAGLIIITGCAHPNIANIAKQAKDYLGKDIYLLLGGFHLKGKDKTEIRNILQYLKNLGVTKVAPSHCTGEMASNMFKEVWGDDYIKSGCGTVIDLPEID